MYLRVGGGGGTAQPKVSYTAREGGVDKHIPRRKVPVHEVVLGLRLQGSGLEGSGLEGSRLGGNGLEGSGLEGRGQKLLKVAVARWRLQGRG